MLTLGILLAFTLCGAPAEDTKTFGESLGITTCETDIDIVFVLDMSAATANIRNFFTMRESCIRIVQGFSPMYVRAALVLLWGNSVEILYEFSDVATLQSLFSYLEFSYEGSFEPGNFENAVMVASFELFTEMMGHRLSAMKFIMYMTSGSFSLYDDGRWHGLQDRVAADHDVHILAILIGYAADMYPLEAQMTFLNMKSKFKVPDIDSLDEHILILFRNICPVCDEGSGWTYYDGRCHLAVEFDEDITWLEAKSQCQNRRSHLTTIRDSEEDSFVNTLVPSSSDTTYIGLRKDYRNRVNTGLYRWDDGTIMTYTNGGVDGADGGSLERCFLKNMKEDKWQDVFCGYKVARNILCTKHALNVSLEYVTPSLPVASSSGFDHDLFTNCTNGELVSKFKFCDGKFDCKDKSDESNCGTSCTSTQFQCTKGGCVSFSFYCDGTRDCADGSDENCEKGSCASDEWRCRNGQCIDSRKRCDLFQDCYDKTDEADCEICRSFVCFDGKCIPNSWVNDGVVDCDGFNGEDERNYTFTNDLSAVDITSELQGNVSTGSVCMYKPDMLGKAVIHFPSDGNCSLVECEETHYKCPNSYCIPIQYVCNGVNDCLDAADEQRCYEYRCPGYYPCSGETYCIPQSQLCDGIPHCPHGDDERMCQSECPPSCICSGRVIRCDSNFNETHQIPKDVRKLDLSGMNLQLIDVDFLDLHYLTVLILSSSNIIRMEGVFPKFPNVLTLDVSHNMISHLVKDSFSKFPKLKHLDLSNNVNLSNIDNGTFLEVPELEQLNLFNTFIMELKATFLWGLSNLRTLNMSHSHLNYINVGSFSSLQFLEYLDIRQNNILQFYEGSFGGLSSLKQLQTDSYKLCCDSVRPKSLNKHDCLSSQSTIASCEDLLGQDILRILLWIIAVIAVVGNILVIIYRFIYNRKSLHKSYGVLVTNLSIADFFMGLYMMIIGFVDSSFKGSYVWHDYEWRHSTLCAFAGFLSTLSSEASCIFITLITLDRLLAVAFPFGQLRFSLKTTGLSAAISWIIAILLAGIPLLPSLKWNLYSQNSVCLALPLSNDRQPGWEYSAGIFVGFNFVMFLLIGVCQVLIYRAVTTSSTIRSSKSSHDTTITRRLILVVLTDFLCWFPVGVMGVLSLRGVSIDGEVYAWTAVTVLPVNSALNPVLYTIPSIVQAWRDARKEEKLSSTRETGPSIANHPMNHVRTYIGVPAHDMETLETTMQSRDVPRDVKCDLICLIVVYILDLHEKKRHFEPVSDENIFVSRCEKDILKVCLSLESRPDRPTVSEDVVYLMQEVRKQCDVRDQSEIREQSEDVTSSDVTTDI